MAIDPRLYEKYSGRKGDPYTRLGQALAQSAKAKQERDTMPKGVRGGFRIMGMPGFFAQIFFWWKDSVGRFQTIPRQRDEPYPGSGHRPFRSRRARASFNPSLSLHHRELVFRADIGCTTRSLLRVRALRRTRALTFPADGC